MLKKILIILCGTFSVLNAGYNSDYNFGMNLDPICQNKNSQMAIKPLQKELGQIQELKFSYKHWSNPQKQHYKGLVAKYVRQQESPISFLFECDSTTCPFSIRVNPSVRVGLEDQISQTLRAIGDKNDNTKTSIKIISLGAGGFAQDERSVFKGLKQDCSTKIDYCAIDPLYGDMLNTYYTEKGIGMDITRRNFNKFFDTHFPGRVRSSFFASVNDYFGKEEINKVDIVWAVDVDGPAATRNGSLEDYTLLLKHVLKNNPDNKNFILKNGGGSFRYKPVITSYKLDTLSGMLIPRVVKVFSDARSEYEMNGDTFENDTDTDDEMVDILY